MRAHEAVWRLLLPALLIAGCAESTPALRDAADAPDAGEAADAEDAAEAEVPGCRPGQVDCGGTCVDPTTDPRNCGRCGRACAAGEVCNEGVCASACSGGLTNCGGACVDLATDPDHCGDCSTACARTEECAGGRCVCVPSCAGRECGDNGCGGSCGTCPAGTACDPAGRCVCVPDCAGRECGDDGCGGSCGSCGPGFVCDPAGTCSCPGTPCGAACCGTGEACLGGACCDPTWRVETPTGLLAVARDLDGTLYVAGSNGTQAYVAAYDACGNRLRERSFLDPATATGSSLAAIALSGADLYVAGQTLSSGTDPGSGLWLRLSKATLATAWSLALYGGDYLDEIWSLGVTPDGNGWMVGTTHLDAPPTYAWVVRGYTDTGRACGFGLFPSDTSGTLGRGLLLAGGRVHVAGTQGGHAVVTSFADDDCGFTTGTCPCTPSGPATTVEFAGASFTEVRALAAAGGSIYAAGFASVEDDIGTVLARINGAIVTFAPRWNPTAQIDGYTELAADAGGSALYAVGTRGWPGSGDAGQGVLARYGAAALTAEWQALLDGTYACMDVLVDGDGGIVVACFRTGSGSLLARCLPSGVCP